MQNVIKEYIRDEKRNPHGVCVAVRENDEIFYGFSLCNPLDKYDKELGYKIALARATSPSYQLPLGGKTCDAVLTAFENLEERALKYFKDLQYSQVALHEDLR